VERAKLNQKPTFRVQGVPSSAKGIQGGVAAETPPRAIYSPQPEYTDEARQSRREGICVVSLMVGIDGRPSNVVVTKKLGMGLDEKAVEALRKWKFEPARRSGRPVPARLSLSLSFKILGAGDKFLQLSEKAKTGDPAAEFELANAFFEGRDVPKDESQGLALLARTGRSRPPASSPAPDGRTNLRGRDQSRQLRHGVRLVHAGAARLSGAK